MPRARKKSRRRRNYPYKGRGSKPTKIEGYTRSSGSVKRHSRHAKGTAPKKKATRKKTARKKPAKRKATRKKSTRTKRKNPSYRRRRTTTKRRNPSRKRRRRRTTTKRRNPSRKRRRRRATSKRRNPSRKRRRRKTTSTRRRRSRKRRKNPSSRRRRRRARRNPGVVKTVQGQLRKIMKGQWIVPSAQIAVGMVAASWGPTYLSRWTSRFGLSNFGYGGVALSGISTVLGASLAIVMERMLPKGGLLGACCKQLGKHVFIGGATYTLGRLLKTAFPMAPVIRSLPITINGGMSLPAGDMSGMGAYGYGSYPGQYPSYGPLGMVESPEQLVAGESYARQSSGMADWLSLEGMGQPVPVDQIMGMHGHAGHMGMGDWFTLDPAGSFVQDNAFDPGSQRF